MTTARLRVPTPEPLELIDATKVSDVIADTSRELGTLEREARELTASAEQAEAAARAINVDAASTTWTLVRLQRFLDDLRSEARRDAATMVEVARQHARIRVEDARAMAARGEQIRPADRVEWPMPIVEPVAPPVFAPAPTPSPPTMPTMPAPVAPAAPATPVAPAASATPVAPAAAALVAEPQIAVVPIPAAPRATLAVAPVAVVPPVAALPTPELVVPMAPAVAVPIAAPQPVLPQPVVPEAVVDPVVAKPAKAKKKRRGFLPLSAVLEVLAVVLLLAFIVMRLS